MALSLRRRIWWLQARDTLQQFKGKRVFLAGHLQALNEGVEHGHDECLRQVEGLLREMKPVPSHVGQRASFRVIKEFSRMAIGG